MTLEPPVWCRFNESKHSPVLAYELLLTCFLGKVFHYWVGRNAYYGAWSATYPGDSSFSLDREELRNRIEEERVQGSTFTLTELPALVLLGRRLCLVLFQHEGHSPFEYVPSDVVSGDTLLEVARSVAYHAQTVNLFTASADLPKPATLPYQTWVSYPQGANYRLGWAPRGDRYDIEPILTVYSAVCMRLNSRPRGKPC